MKHDDPFCYLDSNATTRIAPEVTDAMLPFLSHVWGNPSSAYRFGHEIQHAVESAREQVATLLHADPREIIFTSCGTESNNTAIHSALATQPDKRHVVTTAVEHSANIQYAKFLQKQGCDVTLLPVDSDGGLDLCLLQQAIQPDTAIVSVMWANNETGVIFPVEEISAICRSREVLFHTDAVQAPGKIPLDMQAVECDMLSLSAHKLHAPKGIGALYIRRRTPFQSYIIGGHQERSRRGGTENVPYIIGFGKAAELALENLPEEQTRIRQLRDRIERAILQSIPRTYRNGGFEPRLPNTTNLSFEGIEAEAALLLLDRLGICASSGSACTTGSIEPSHVLTAMGIPRARAKGALRFSLSHFSTDADADYLLEHLPAVISRLRAETPVPAV